MEAEQKFGGYSFCHLGRDKGRKAKKQNLPGKPYSAISQAEAIGKPPNPQSAGGLGLAVNRPVKAVLSLLFTSLLNINT